MSDKRDLTDEDRLRDDLDFWLACAEEMREQLDEMIQRMRDRRHTDRVSVAEHPGWSD